MHHEITSRKTGETYEFHLPERGGYLSVTLPNESQPRQACEHGRVIGETIIVRDPREFIRECRRWYRAHMAAEARYERSLRES